LKECEKSLTFHQQVISQQEDKIKDLQAFNEQLEEKKVSAK